MTVTNINNTVVVRFEGSQYDGTKHVYLDEDAEDTTITANGTTFALVLKQVRLMAEDLTKLSVQALATQSVATVIGAL